MAFIRRNTQGGGKARRFGLLRYVNTGNLGDEIQSLAARRFLPHVDRLLDRDRLNAPGWACPRLGLIMNGWFTNSPENWPPHSVIEPLIISFHLSDQMTTGGFSAAEALVVGENAAWLRHNGPIGARDPWTFELLRRNDIDAWFSGCLTLTLCPPSNVVRKDYIVLSDVSAEIAASASRQTRSKMVTTTHAETKTNSSRVRFSMAESLLRLYAEARCVVTSRLHCALPCLAMDTPVLLIPPRSAAKRMGGLSSLVRTCTPAEFLARRAAFDLEAAPNNPQGFLPLRAKLLEQCRAFTE
jgi:hypothetical protein